MLHDRNIVITIGNNRKSVSWQPLSIALSEFYEKLRVPSRSTETMQAYLSLKKSEQDDRRIRRRQSARCPPEGGGCDRARPYHTGL